MTLLWLAGDDEFPAGGSQFPMKYKGKRLEREHE